MRFLMSLASIGSIGGFSGRVIDSSTRERVDDGIERELVAVPRRTATSKPLNTKAHCLKGDASVPDQGAGANWVCTITFLIDGADTPVSFNWNLTVKPDGCWTAEGTPAQLGGQTIQTRTGKSVTDPIYAIDGCFPAT